jgi:hypothetical protein
MRIAGLKALATGSLEDGFIVSSSLEIGFLYQVMASCNWQTRAGPGRAED